MTQKSAKAKPKAKDPEKIKGKPKDQPKGPTDAAELELVVIASEVEVRELLAEHSMQETLQAHDDGPEPDDDDQFVQVKSSSSASDVKATDPSTVKIKWVNGPRNLVLQGAGEPVLRIKHLLELNGIHAALIMNRNQPNSALTSSSSSSPSSSSLSTLTAGILLGTGIPFLLLLLSPSTFHGVFGERLTAMATTWITNLEDYLSFGTILLAAAWILVCLVAFLKLVFYFFFSPLPSPSDPAAQSRY